MMTTIADVVDKHAKIKEDLETWTTENNGDPLKDLLAIFENQFNQGPLFERHEFFHVAILTAIDAEKIDHVAAAISQVEVLDEQSKEQFGLWALHSFNQGIPDVFDFLLQHPVVRESVTKNIDLFALRSVKEALLVGNPLTSYGSLPSIKIRTMLTSLSSLPEFSDQLQKHLLDEEDEFKGEGASILEDFLLNQKTSAAKKNPRRTLHRL